jgi:hypothetical protein
MCTTPWQKYMSFTFCAIVYHAYCTSLNAQHIKNFYAKRLFLKHRSRYLCYDGGFHEYAGNARGRGDRMDFVAVVDQAITLLRQRGRVTYRTLQLQFQLDAAHLEALKDELTEGQRVAVDEAGRVLVWTGGAVFPPLSAAESVHVPDRVPLSYTPTHLAEKILTSCCALEGERKQVTVLFADLKGSMELLADRDPEEARQLLDPVLACLMEAVHRYGEPMHQVMGPSFLLEATMMGPKVTSIAVHLRVCNMTTRAILIPCMPYSRRKSRHGNAPCRRGPPAHRLLVAGRPRTSHPTDHRCARP